ncbi:hypothetical protein [Pedosphaera parvula]|uniref:Uncharacterized protein n=1 Tax=Pedosphaera parvula (strain Ellin514) TaxID=320771 RepID=B9XRM0_PEDPL|nr:hypothetical protein [Pedosphaera parvula]EEF57491.1 conserved hypothetical protein-signal peptide and transmembrane prediction [Pedosphaera parvula Ellin514]
MYPAMISPEEQTRRDKDQIRLLAIFHFIFSALALLGIPFLFLHYAIMHRVFSNPQLFQTPRGPALPRDFLDLLVWMYVVVGVVLIIGSLLNLLSGFFLWRRKHRMFSLVVAGIDCLQIPFGTALGVFAIIVLQRESVQRLYASGVEQA